MSGNNRTRLSDSIRHLPPGERARHTRTDHFPTSSVSKLFYHINLKLCVKFFIILDFPRSDAVPAPIFTMNPSGSLRRISHNFLAIRKSSSLPLSRSQWLRSFSHTPLREQNDKSSQAKSPLVSAAAADSASVFDEQSSSPRQATEAAKAPNPMEATHTQATPSAEATSEPSSQSSSPGSKSPVSKEDAFASAFAGEITSQSSSNAVSAVFGSPAKENSGVDSRSGSSKNYVASLVQKAIGSAVTPAKGGRGAAPGSMYSDANYVAAHGGLLHPSTAKPEKAGKPIDQHKPYKFSIFSHRQNTHVTVCKPNGDAIVSLSTGNLGFKKAQRKKYDAAYQLAAHVLNLLTKDRWNEKITNMELALRGFGPGREAVTKALVGYEGRFLKTKWVRVSDATRVKFGGTRSMNPRRLG